MTLHLPDGTASVASCSAVGHSAPKSFPPWLYRFQLQSRVPTRTRMLAPGKKKAPPSPESRGTINPLQRSSGPAFAAVFCTRGVLSPDEKCEKPGADRVPTSTRRDRRAKLIWRAGERYWPIWIFQINSSPPRGLAGPGTNLVIANTKKYSAELSWI